MDSISTKKSVSNIYNDLFDSEELLNRFGPTRPNSVKEVKPKLPTEEVSSETFKIVDKDLTAWDPYDCL